MGCPSWTVLRIKIIYFFFFLPEYTKPVKMNLTILSFTKEGKMKQHFQCQWKAKPLESLEKNKLICVLSPPIKTCSYCNVESTLNFL